MRRRGRRKRLHGSERRLAFFVAEREKKRVFPKLIPFGEAPRDLDLSSPRTSPRVAEVESDTERRVFPAHGCVAQGAEGEFPLLLSGRPAEECLQVCKGLFDSNMRR